MQQVHDGTIIEWSRLKGKKHYWRNGLTCSQRTLHSCLCTPHSFLQNSPSSSLIHFMNPLPRLFHPFSIPFCLWWILNMDLVVTSLFIACGYGRKAIMSLSTLFVTLWSVEKILDLDSMAHWWIQQADSKAIPKL